MTAAGEIVRLGDEPFKMKRRLFSSSLSGIQFREIERLRAEAFIFSRTDGMKAFGYDQPYRSNQMDLTVNATFKSDFTTIREETSNSIDRMTLLKPANLSFAIAFAWN